MFGGLKNMFSMVDVKQERDLVTIEGISAYDFKKDFGREWPAGLVDNILTKNSSGYRISFYAFFVPDMIFVFRKIAGNRYNRIQAPKYRYVADLIEKNTWAVTTITEQPGILDFSLLAKMNVSLMDHQVDFLNTYNLRVPQYRLNGYMLSLPAGTGKTIAALALGTCLDSDVFIIVAPNNSLYTVWEATIKSRFNEVPEVWVSQDKKPFTDSCKFFIFHFEALEKAKQLVQSRRFKKPFIVLDESHNFNEITAQRTNTFIEICQMLPTRNVIWSSGTPIKALGAEVIPFLSTVDPMFKGRTVEIFKNVYGMSRTRGIEILSNRIGLMSFKTDKALVVTTEPIVEDILVKTDDSSDYTLENIRLDMKAFIEERTKFYKANFKSFVETYEEALAAFEKSPYFDGERKNYSQYKTFISQIRKGYDPATMKDMVMFCNKFEKGVIAPALKQPLKNAFLDARSVVKYLELKIQGECLGRILGRKRIDCYRSLVNSAPLTGLIKDSAKKTVIFTSYVDVVDDVSDRLTKDRLNPLVVYGDTNSMVTSIVKRFETDPNANPMIATFKSLSTAVPLIVANSIIMMNTPFRDYEYQQAVSRCHRLGQDTQVYVYRVLLDTGEEPNISTRSKDIMEWSMQQVNQLLGINVAADSSVALESVDMTHDAVFGTTMEEPQRLALPSVESRSLNW